MRYLILSIILFTTTVYAQDTSTPLPPPIEYESIPDLISIGQEIYTQGFEDAVVCMSTMFLRYEYNKDIERPSIKWMGDRCRTRFNIPLH